MAGRLLRSGGGGARRAIGRRLESSPEIAPAIANLWMFNTARGRMDRAREIAADLFRMAREPATRAYCCKPIIAPGQTNSTWASSNPRSSTPKPAWPYTIASVMRTTATSTWATIRAGARWSLALAPCGVRYATVVVGLPPTASHSPASWATRLRWRTRCGGLAKCSRCTATHRVIAFARELLELTDVHGLPMPRAYALDFSVGIGAPRRVR